MFALLSATVIVFFLSPGNSHTGAVLISHPAEIDLKTPFLIHQLTVVTIVTFSSLLLFVLKIRAVDKVPPQTAWLNERHKVRVILLFLCNNYHN